MNEHVLSDNTAKIERFKSSGQSTYYYSTNGLTHITNTTEQLASEFLVNDELAEVALIAVQENYTFPVYDLISGENFAKLVHTGVVSDYDGRVANVFVDGYDSNLGIIDIESNFCQGRFVVDVDTFLRICQLHHVEVNWANK